MVRAIALSVGLGAAASAFIITRHGTNTTTSPRVDKLSAPVVLELYQSQGCSSCPPALEVLRQEADRPNVIALSFAVTYWDELGWKDSFAQPAFTQRQWDYAHANGRGNVATPQLIINGRSFVNGGNRAEVDAAIRQFGAAPASAPSLNVETGRLMVGAAKAAKPASVWLVSYDPRTVHVPIRAGENGGRTLAHRNVVRALEKIGPWAGRQQTYRLPPRSAGLARAILVQTGTGGPIIAALQVMDGGDG